MMLTVTESIGRFTSPSVCVPESKAQMSTDVSYEVFRKQLKHFYDAKSKVWKARKPFL